MTIMINILKLKEHRALVKEGKAKSPAVSKYDSEGFKIKTKNNLIIQLKGYVDYSSHAIEEIGIIVTANKNNQDILIGFFNDIDMKSDSISQDNNTINIKLPYMTSTWSIGHQYSFEIKTCAPFVNFLKESLLDKAEINAISTYLAANLNELISLELQHHQYLENIVCNVKQAQEAFLKEFTKVPRLTELCKFFIVKKGNEHKFEIEKLPSPLKESTITYLKLLS